MQASRERFRAEVSQLGAVTVIEVVGEVDCTSGAEFEAALLGFRPRLAPRVIVDITSMEFLSVAGFVALGRLSGEVAHLTIWSSSGVAGRVLGSIGYPDVTCRVTVRSDGMSRVDPRSVRQPKWSDEYDGRRSGRSLAAGRLGDASGAGCTVRRVARQPHGAYDNSSTRQLGGEPYGADAT